MKKIIVLLSLMFLLSCNKEQSEPIVPGTIYFINQNDFPAYAYDYIQKNKGPVTEQCWFVCEYNSEKEELCRTKFSLEEANNGVNLPANIDTKYATACFHIAYDGGFIDYYYRYALSVDYNRITSIIIENLSAVLFSLKPTFLS